MFGHFGNRHFPGEVRCKPRLIDLVSELRRELAVIGREDSGRHALRLSSSVASLPMTTDLDHVECIFMNLLQNAVKYTPTGGSVSVTIGTADEGALVVVADSGIGIPKSALSQIYMPHFRAVNVGARPGSGLGLAVVRQSAGAIGAVVEVHSVVGRGTTFSVRIPSVEHLAPVASAVY